MTVHRLRNRALAGVLAATASGCTHTVVPPAATEQPVSVFLLDHGRTSSLVLPHEGALARYSYGEWAWYARNRTGVFRASGALLSDSRAALGRSILDAEPTLADVRAATAVPIESAWEIEVPAARVRALDAELDALFQRHSAEAVNNPRVALRFVPHPEPYSLGHNSNHMTAAWLRRVECRVETRGPYSSWRVERPRERDGRD